MTNKTLAHTLSALESELHRPDIRGNAQRVDALLHPDFEEVGRSGRHWTRDAIIAMLLAETEAIEVVADRYAATELQPGVALLTYRAAHRQADGSLARHTLRSSVWVLAGAQWRMRYHQGTAAAEAWS